MNKSSKIFVAGHRGMVGRAIVNKLQELGYSNIIYRTKSELDLRNQLDVECFISSEKPGILINAAAKVGGIMANMNSKAAFFYDNLMISTNIIHAAYKSGVKRLINLGSSCIYPVDAPQPFKEEYLLTGSFEPTNDAYALAKTSAIKMCQFYNQQYGTDFISVIPTNLYGPHDNFDLESSHVIPALISKIHQAKQCGNSKVVLWGDGTPLREFLYVEDLAEAIIKIMQSDFTRDIGDIINIGSGKEISIQELGKLIASIIGYNGQFVFDNSKPNGVVRKRLDISRIEALGWRPRAGLPVGLEAIYRWYIESNR